MNRDQENDSVEMSYNQRYYEDNLQRSFRDPTKVHEKQFLLRTNRNAAVPYPPTTTYHHHQHPTAQSRNPRSSDINNEEHEHHQLLVPGPVRFSPSWEEKNLPSDELNFKNLSLDEVADDKPPRDRWNLVYLIFLLHGIGTLMPWNMFINAKVYYQDYKLKDDGSEATKSYRANFMNYITLAAQIPNLLFNFINLFMQLGGNLTTRIVFSILVEIVVFIGTVVLAMVDSSSWTIIFFWVTIASVVLLNMANGIYQNSVYGMAGNLPMKYSNAVVLGSNVSGTIVALVYILSIKLSPDHRTAAIYYFIAALFVLLACFDTYFALPLLRFYRFYEHQAEKQKNLTSSSWVNRTPYWYIFKKCFPQLWNVFFVFFVTLSIYPSVHADIQQSDPNFVIQGNYYPAVLCFFVFNFFAMIGSLFPMLCKLGPRWLWLPVLLRFLFIPAFLFCNYNPKDTIRLMPVIICNDWAHLGLGVAMGFTSGYLSSLAMMYVPRSVEPQYAAVAGMMGATSLIVGLCCGLGFALVMPVIVSSPIFEFSLPDDFACNMSTIGR